MTLSPPVVKITAPPLGTEECGCCAPAAAATPQAPDNRAGLSAIPYRIGDYSKFRASLHVALSSSQFAPLQRLHTRKDDDFTIGLVDAFACAADILTFYQERIANESYLLTATERVSLQEMGKLVSYQLRPGVAAETWLAFALETPSAPPPGAGREPGSFVTGVPTRLTIERGVKIQSVPGPEEKPQIFETVETLADARPEWNAILAPTQKRRRPASGDTAAWFTGVRTNVKAGDALIFVGDEFSTDQSSGNWEFRLVQRHRRTLRRPHMRDMAAAA